VVHRGGGETQETCCSNSVGPNGRFQSLREAVETLLQAELRPDVSICLLPGDHAIEEQLLLVPPDGQPWNVEITGSGRGTRLVLEAGVTVHAEGLASLALRHFDLHAKQTDRPVQIFSVGDLTLEDCQWEERVFSNSLVSIAGVQRMRLSDTTLRQEVPDDPSKAVALAVSDPQAETSWDNCRFIGQVVLYARELAPTEANVFHQIATISNANELELGEPLNNLRASGCHFTRIVVDSAFSADIFQGNRPQPYRSIHLSDCLFPNSENQVLAPHFTLDAARFQIDEGDSVLLTGVSRTAIYTGNASPGRDFRIVAGVPGGLIGINIQHVANLLTMSDP
jgi:hypothetical protein